jgi:O-antigen chain-terminating methyltransferase
MRRIRAGLPSGDAERKEPNIPPASPLLDPSPHDAEEGVMPNARPPSVSLIERLKRKRGIRSVMALFYGAPVIRQLPELKRRAEGTEGRLSAFADAIASQMVKIESEMVKQAALFDDSVAGTLNEIKQLERRVSGTASAFAMLDKRLGELEQLEYRVSETASAFAVLDKRVGELDKRVGELVPLSQMETLQAEMTGGLSAVRMQLTDQWRHAVNQKLRLDVLLVEARRRLPEPFDQSMLSSIVAEQDRALDAFYVGFEDRFRGTRADIKKRQDVYLSRVKIAAEATGGLPVVDIGCGRGEWLELLDQHGISAKGYDINRIMITECRARGIDATLGDALEAIHAVPNDSAAAITGFHIIEHIPFTTMISLFDQCLRVLHPGGLVAFETPNPANLQVAAERFYYDPTHRNPLPSELVAFMAEARGFCRVEVLPLHPMESPVQSEYQDPMLELLRQKLFGPQDYGVIAWKDR